MGADPSNGSSGLESPLPEFRFAALGLELEAFASEGVLKVGVALHPSWVISTIPACANYFDPCKSGSQNRTPHYASFLETDKPPYVLF